MDDSSLLSYLRGHLIVVAAAVFVALLGVAGYFLWRWQQKRKEYLYLHATFRLTVPSSNGPVELNYGHIELLSELVRPRAEHHFLLEKNEWEERLGSNLGSAIAVLTGAGLLRASRNIATQAVITSRGAELVAQYGSKPKARAAAEHRLRKRQAKEKRAIRVAEAAAAEPSPDAPKSEGV